jgi:hypothetical protein
LDQTGDISEDEGSSSNGEDEAKADGIAKGDGLDDLNDENLAAEEREGWKGYVRLML